MTPEFSGPSLSQYLIVMSFVFVTLLILYFIKKNKHLITNKINSKKRLKVSDITLLGQGDRALILNIDEKDYLFLNGHSKLFLKLINYNIIIIMVTLHGQFTKPYMKRI